MYVDTFLSILKTKIEKTIKETSLPLRILFFLIKNRSNGAQVVGILLQQNLTSEGIQSLYVPIIDFPAKNVCYKLIIHKDY